MNKRCNVLWLFCEDVSPWIPLYGDNTISTPNLDALAENGVVFRNCFSSAPVCSPARSGIITGCMPTTIGVHNHVTSRLEEPKIFLPNYMKTLPQILREQGYFTFNFGKDDYNFEYNREKLYAGEHEIIEFYGEHGKAIYWNDREDKEMPFFGQITLWGGKNAVEPKTKVDEKKVEVAPYYPSTNTYKEQYIKHYNQLLRTDEEIGLIVDKLKEDGEYDNTIIIFMSDHGYELLRSKQFLYDGGTHVPFIIHFPKGIEGKHATSCTREDLVSSIDIAATTLRLCDVDIPDYMESLDVFSSDSKREFVISARDRCDFTIDRIRSVRTRKYKYIKNFYTDRPLMQPQYRDKEVWFKEWFELKEKGELSKLQSQFISPERVSEELYNIEHDPHETINLATNPEYKYELSTMRRTLEQWIMNTDDKGQYKESLEQHVALIKRWGEQRCMNPEYDEAKEYLSNFRPATENRIENLFCY